jgi:hypothetical protein
MGDWALLQRPPPFAVGLDARRERSRAASRISGDTALGCLGHYAMKLVERTIENADALDPSGSPNDATIQSRDRVGPKSRREITPGPATSEPVVGRRSRVPGFRSGRCWSTSTASNAIAISSSPGGADLPRAVASETSVAFLGLERLEPMARAVFFFRKVSDGLKRNARGDHRQAR